jgi:hypothetical protein
MSHPGEARTGLVGTWLGAALALILGGACSDNAVVAKRDAGPVCTPSGATELACSDGVDDDCDGQSDCLDMVVRAGVNRAGWGVQESGAAWRRRHTEAGALDVLPRAIAGASGLGEAPLPARMCLDGKELGNAFE